MTKAPSRAMVDMATAFADIGRQLAESAESEAVFATLTRVAVEEVPGAEHAGVTRGHRGHFETVAPTSDAVLVIDRIQYELESGPCVDALLSDGVYLTGALNDDERWPEFGSRAYEATGILSMLSLRLFLEHDASMIAGLNLYSSAADAFDATSRTMGSLLATHGMLAVQAATARAKAENLNRALTTSRDIGTAIGILMATHKITRDQGFDLLRIASQTSHRKLADVALDVVESGALAQPTSVRARRAGDH